MNVFLNMQKKKKKKKFSSIFLGELNYISLHPVV